MCSEDGSGCTRHPHTERHGFTIACTDTQRRGWYSRGDSRCRASGPQVGGNACICLPFFALPRECIPTSTLSLPISLFLFTCIIVIIMSKGLLPPFGTLMCVRMYAEAEMINLHSDAALVRLPAVIGRLRMMCHSCPCKQTYEYIFFLFSFRI